MNSKLKFRIAQLLLNDYGFINNRGEIFDALDIAYNTQFAVEQQYKEGKIQMYELIRWMLNEWHAKNGNKATIEALKNTLAQIGLQSAAVIIDDNINEPEEAKIKRRHNSLSSQPMSKAMQTRNLAFLHCLDVGQFGDIYKALRFFDNREFSIKRISVGKFISQTKRSSEEQDPFEKLFREVKTMATVQNSPHIVSHFDYWFEGPLEQTYQPLLANIKTKIPLELVKGKPLVSKDADDTYFCILMELCETNLETWMDNTAERSLELVEGIIIKQILIGLNYMHTQAIPIVHRDLKPKNILMTELGDKMLIKIGDLGLARELKESDTSLTVQVGFRDYRSPEMERGDKYDVKTDIFSLGLIYLVLICNFKSTDNLISALVSARRGNLEVVGKAEEIHGRDFPLLRQMLERRADNRPNTVQCLDLLDKQTSVLERMEIKEIILKCKDD